MPTQDTSQALTGTKSQFGYRAYRSSGTYTTILAKLKELNLPKVSFDKPEATTLASTVKESRRGLAEVEVSFTLRMDFGDPLTRQSVADLVESATSMYDMACILSDGSMYTFSGFVSEYTPGPLSPTDIIEAEFTVSCQDFPVYVPPTTS